MFRPSHRSRARGLKEPVRWLLCFAAAGILEVAAYVHVLLHSVGVPAPPRPQAIQVRLRTQSPSPDTPARRALAEPPDDPTRGAEPVLPQRAEPGPEGRPRPAAPPLRKPVPATEMIEDAKAALREARLPADPLEVSPAALRERLERAATQAKPPADPAREVARAERLTHHVSAESTQEIADYLGYQKGTEYVPRTPPPPGPFRFNDSVPYELERIAREDGSPTYRMTLVDRDGRLNTFILPEEEDPRQYDTLYRLFQMSRDNEALRVILRRMVLPMLSQMRRQAREASRPGPPPATAK